MKLSKSSNRGGRRENAGVALRAIGIITTALIVIMPTIISRADESQWKWDAEWKLSGQNLNNTRNQATERYLKPENVANLSPKWVFTTGGDIFCFW